MLSFDCGMCGAELTQPGAILFGPPRLDSTVTKRHLCGACFNAMLALIERRRSALSHPALTEKEKT